MVSSVDLLRLPLASDEDPVLASGDSLSTVGRLLAPIVCVLLRRSNLVSGSGGASSSPMTAGFDSDDLLLRWNRWRTSGVFPEFCSRFAGLRRTIFGWFSSIEFPLLFRGPMLMAKAFWRLLSQFLSSFPLISLIGFLFRFVSGGTHDWRLSEMFFLVKSSDGGAVLN